MPIFSRRRLQEMFEQLGPYLTQQKANDILSRVEHKNTQLATAAELEMSLLWAIAQVAHLEIEPTFPPRRTQIDALSKDLFGRSPAAIEITALSDDTFSGKVDMDRAANIIGQFADRVRRGTNKHLYFEFTERSFYEKGRYNRIRNVAPDFTLTRDLEERLTSWLKKSDWPEPKSIRLTDQSIDVVITWKQSVHKLFRTHCSMPPLAYHVEDNPLYKALRKKERQLAAAPTGYLKCIFLGDAGCSMLRWLRPMNSAGREVGGEQIIRHFLSTADVALVCVFSASRSSREFFTGRSTLFWQVTIFPKNGEKESDYGNLRKLATRLPQPNLEGYQARSRHLQGSFQPQARGQYLGTHMTSNDFSSSIKLSARLVLEFLAGRVTPEQFQHFAFRNDANLLDNLLARGMMIQNVRIEKVGVDEDDDYFVFDLDFDVAASPLSKPKAIKGGNS